LTTSFAQRSVLENNQVGTMVWTTCLPLRNSISTMNPLPDVPRTTRYTGYEFGNIETMLASTRHRLQCCTAATASSVMLGLSALLATWQHAALQYLNQILVKQSRIAGSVSHHLKMSRISEARCRTSRRDDSQMNNDHESLDESANHGTPAALTGP